MGKSLLTTCYRIREALNPGRPRPGLTPKAWVVRPVETTAFISFVSAENYITLTSTSFVPIQKRTPLTSSSSSTCSEVLGSTSGLKSLELWVLSLHNGGGLALQ